MRKPFIILIFLFGILPVTLSQGIRGEIRDMNDEPVPYAAIFIKELTRGTTCNALGLFSLPLPKGEYTIFFRSLGYTEVSKTIEVLDEYIELAIQLPPQTYMIPEVRISASGEDPAYWIMRKTIGLANYHLHEVSNYDAEIYIKGTAYIEKMPRAIARRIQVSEIKVKEDEVYMLESLNQVQYTAPDKYEMQVIASQNTLPGYTQNVNPMDYINASLYQQQIESFVSPLARNAFSYYRYSFEGTFLEGINIVNKIKVIPKRKSQQLCEGYLYIVEDLWCLHSSDLSVHTIAGTLFLQQLYANIIMDAWLPVNHKLQANVEIAGVKGNVTYVSSLKYADVTLNPNLPEAYFTAMNDLKKEPGATAGEQKPISKEQEKINELLKKEELSNRDVTRLSKLMEKEAAKADTGKDGEELNQTGTTFSVAKNAVKNDSLYWNRVRPIPLTPEEHVTLQVRDSIIGSRAVGTKTDSVRMASRRGKPVRNILLGKTYRGDLGRFRFTHGGLIDISVLGYNTVDGLYYGQDFRLNWKPDSIHTLRSSLLAGYAFHRKAPMISWNSDLLYAPMARGKVAIYLNYTSSDFNGSTGIPTATNLVYTLFLRENYRKMYEQIDATLYNRIDVANGLVLTTSASYGVQNSLTNHSDFSFLLRKKKDFTANTPADLQPDDPVLGNHQRLAAQISLEFTPRHYYVIRNFRKSMRKSKWPTFSLAYRQAIPLEETGWSDFSLVEVGIGQILKVGLLSELDWSVESGYFTGSESIHFSDFKHFKTSPLLIDMAGFDRAFMLLNYYEASTDEYWTSLQTTLTSSYLLVKFLPWFSERLWKESIGISYLYTPHIPHYVQLGYSLNELFFLADIGVYVGFQNWSYKGFGVKINFRF
ncbi:MAG: carboxypeptidase-like regulatory domain-containing protein [Bacteroidales bacterium]|nr:carboxypeptidase-like regulatory domain-containing protein [Bacteroidales bacterium]